MKKHSPNRIEGYLDHATARINQGDAMGAEADLIRVEQLAPDSSLPYAKLGELRLAQRRPGDAESLFRQALSHNPDSLEAAHGLVEALLQKNKPAEALKFVSDQIIRNPNSSGLYQLQAEVFLQTKQWDQAQSSFARAIELDTKNVRAMALLAQLEATRGQSDQAIANYQRAIAVVPNDAALYIALGRTYESIGNWQQAETTYQKALTIQPENALASNNLAYLMLEHGGSVNVALTLAQTARRGLPDLPNSADTLGWAYYHNGAFSVAAPLLEDAVKRVPGNLAYRYHLGLTYQKLNETMQARSQFDKIIDLDPKSPFAEQARQALSNISTP